MEVWQRLYDQPVSLSVQRKTIPDLLLLPPSLLLPRVTEAAS
jgi:hypothetical protein